MNEGNKILIFGGVIIIIVLVSMSWLVVSVYLDAKEVMDFCKEKGFITGKLNKKFSKDTGYFECNKIENNILVKKYYTLKELIDNKNIQR